MHGTAEIGLCLRSKLLLDLALMFHCDARFNGGKPVVRLISVAAAWRTFAVWFGVHRDVLRLVAIQA